MYVFVEHRCGDIFEDEQGSAALLNSTTEMYVDKLTGETSDIGVQTDTQPERESTRESMAKITDQLQASKELLILKEVCNTA